MEGKIVLGASAPATLSEGRGNEERALLDGLPMTPRLRRLLEDLETLMMSEGFLHLSTDDIASRLRCSKATLYRLAPSREKLFELVIEVWLARCRDTGWHEFDAGTDWPGRLIGFLSAAVIATQQTSFKFMSDLQSFPGGHRRLMIHQDRRDADLRRIIDAGIEDGAFSAVHTGLAADLLHVTMRRIIEPEFLVGVGLSLTEAFDQAYQILEYGFIRQPPVGDGEGRSQARAKPGPRSPLAISR